MTDRQELTERVREALRERNPREVRMFGGISFMVDERMVAAARGDESLLLRIDPAEHDRLVALPGAQPAVMGANRPMGPGWITVRADALDGDGLTRWLQSALAFHASQGSG